MLVKVCFCNYGNFPKKITGVIHNANLGLKGAWQDPFIELEVSCQHWAAYLWTFA